jgi:type II secretory pathway component PulK
VSSGRGTTRERGFILVVVLVFFLLLYSSVLLLSRRSVVDATIVAHRDAAAEAEAAARGGVRLAITLLLEDRLQEERSGLRSESLLDPWALVGTEELSVGDGVRMRLRIEDAGARFNLNSLIEKGGKPRKYAEIFLATLLEHVIDEMPGRAEEKRYDAAQLARTVIDWLDADDIRIEGGLEDDVYQRRDPPARAGNRPLLSLDELRLVEGFDGALVEGLRPYASVHPWSRADGINPNTAPPHVLSLLYHGVGGAFELAREEEIKAVLDAREKGELLCKDPQTGGGVCRGIEELVAGEIFPPPTYVSDVFLVRAEARVGEVTRTIETVIDRATPSEPRLLAWRVR